MSVTKGPENFYMHFFFVISQLRFDRCCICRRAAFAIKGRACLLMHSLLLLVCLQLCAGSPFEIYFVFYSVLRVYCFLFSLVMFS